MQSMQLEFEIWTSLGTYPQWWLIHLETIHQGIRSEHSPQSYGNVDYNQLPTRQGRLRQHIQCVQQL